MSDQTTADLTEQRDRARAIAVMLEAECALLRDALTDAHAYLTAGYPTRERWTAAVDKATHALAVTG